MAGAVVGPKHLGGSPELELADGSTPSVASLTQKVTPVLQAQWLSFTNKAGANWAARWDTTTGVPSRIFGEGMSVPGSVKSSKVAEAFAKRFLVENVGLLAPGSTASDFRIAAGFFDGTNRTVSFTQMHDGMEVLGGTLTFRFKKDRMFVVTSSAWPNVRVSAPATLMAPAAAESNAKAWVERDFATKVVAQAPRGPFVLPVASDAGISYRVVLDSTVRNVAGTDGLWSVYVDATTGEPVARRNRIHYASGTVQFKVQALYPSSAKGTVAKPAGGATVSIGGTALTTDAAGLVTWTGTAAASATVSPSGPQVKIVNKAGALLSMAATIQPNGTVLLDKTSVAAEDSQLTTFVSVVAAKAAAKQLAPNLAWLNQQTIANVNVSGSCNAYYDFTSLNFFPGGTVGQYTCNSSARMPEVVMHEFGHAFHDHSYIGGLQKMDSALSEGMSDYFAATYTGNKDFGDGFFIGDPPMRPLETTQPFTWPESISQQDPHETGRIAAQAFWDLRKALIASMGEQAGKAKADAIWYYSLIHSKDIPATYDDALAGDDDDGNMTNGTPNKCLLDAAFARHGLAEVGEGGTTLPSVGAVERVENSVSVTVSEGTATAGCQVAAATGATLEWKLRDDASVSGSEPMTKSGTTFSADLPTGNEGHVVQYQVTVEFAGASTTLPNNAADPWYEAYIGPTVELYCTDFEGGEPDGWTHGASVGTDQWTWGGAVAGAADPAKAHSGSSVYGIALGANYSPDTTQYLESPEVDAAGYTAVRLQYYRWLNSEDGYFDKATISANGTEVWATAASPGDDMAEHILHHTDREWRFQDVDLSDSLQDGKVKVRFQQVSDPGYETGGWTIDDFCIVAQGGGTPPNCGDGKDDPGEQCDDGNLSDGDGCQADCSLPGDGNGGGGGDEGGCGCRVGAANGTTTGVSAGLLLVGLALVPVLRRRRARR